MSTYYIVKEHFVMQDSSLSKDFVKVIIDRLTALEKTMDDAQMNSCDIHLKSDSSTYSFCDTHVNSDFHDLKQAVLSAKHIDLTIFSDYRFYLLQDFAAPRQVAEQLENTPLPENVFYSVYISADADDTVGCIEAYGFKNGKQYHGIPSWQPLTSLPDSGYWITPQTSVTLDMTEELLFNSQKIEEVYRELSSLTVDNTFTALELNDSFFLNNVQLENHPQFELFIKLCASLIQLTDGQCSIEDEFVDISSVDPRIIRLNIDCNGNSSPEIMEF